MKYFGFLYFDGHCLSKATYKSTTVPRNGSVFYWPCKPPALDLVQNHRRFNKTILVFQEVFEYCSTRNLKVLLTCEFMQKFYKENPQYKDLVVVREKMNI